MSSSLSDMRDQGDFLTAVTAPGPVECLAAELYIADHCAGLADQRYLTEVIGLGASPEPRRFSTAARRAVPDGFRRQHRTGGERG